MSNKPKQSPPLIIVTGPKKRWRFSWWATRFMLRVAGLRAVYITPKTKYTSVKVRGVIIGGGDDIDPKHYGFTGDAGSHYDGERDRLEMHVIEKAIENKIPLFGICRGAQLINVKLGGTLHQDIRPHRKLTPNRNSLFPIKKANISQNSILKNILEREQIGINSLHNQAIDKVAQALVVSARDEDYFIQAVESENSQFILGVQWHPEYMPYSNAQRKLFKRFASEVCSSNAELTFKTPF